MILGVDPGEFGGAGLWAEGSPWWWALSDGRFQPGDLATIAQFGVKVAYVEAVIVVPGRSSSASLIKQAGSAGEIAGVLKGIGWRVCRPDPTTWQAAAGLPRSKSGKASKAERDRLSRARLAQIAPSVDWAEVPSGCLDGLLISWAAQRLDGRP